MINFHSVFDITVGTFTIVVIGSVLFGFLLKEFLNKK